MKANKMKTKDLIYSGAFAAVYIIMVLVVVTAMGFVPFLYLFASPAVVGMIGATIYLIYVNKVKKFGAITILALLFGLMTTTGGHPYSIMFAIPLGLIADAVAKSGKYESKKMNQLSYLIFNLTMVGPFFTLVVAKDAFVESVVEYYGQDYGNALAALAVDGLIFIQLGLALVGAIIGCVLANTLFKKHFQKAGIA